MRKLWKVLIALCFSAGLSSALAEAAGDAPGEPELRIEAGMHTAILRHIAVGSQDKFIVSSSFDKTIRIWSVPDGKLQRIIRVPIGPGFEGSVYAVAVSPDGKTIAASGWFKQQFLYLIDVASGNIVKTLGPNPITANTVAFSPDGTKVATVLSRNFGMRLYDVASGALLAEDKSATDDTYGLAFRNDGSYATTSFDGMIRFYDPAGKALATLPAPGGKKPYSIAFTPDGRKMALGYNDTTRVDILAVDVREWLVPPDVTGIEGGTLQAVQWSRDGTILFAGGSNWAEGYYQLWRWLDQGKGQRILTFRNSDAIFDIQQYDQQGIAVGAALPAISIVAHEKLLMHIESPTAGMGRGEKGVLTTNDTGTQVRFALDLAGAEPIMFDMATLELKDMKGVPDDLDPPITGSLYVEDWYGKLEPKIGTKLLTLDPHETSYSLAIARDKGSFILGTAWYVRKFAAAGDLLWRTVIGGLARGVTLVKGDQVAIAALSDGTIRWYRTSDGVELMALFIHRTDKRWIVWTPKGYYAASPGGDDLIGWHVNRGDAEVPDFFSAARFHDRFYRPDVVQKILATLDEDKAIEEANKDAGRENETSSDGVRGILPAVVELAMGSNEIKTATSPVQVSYRVRSPSGEPIEAIDVLIDGRPLEGRAAIAIPGEDDVATLDIPVPAHDSEIGLIARTKTGASEVAIVKVKWDGAFAELLKPKLYAVVVGVSAYDDPDLHLKYAAQDADDFAAALKRQEGGIYGKVEVKLLTDDKASRDDIVEALEWLEGEVRARDVGMVFMAGHGVTDNKQRFYFLPFDVDMQKLRSTAVSRDDLLETMSGLAGKALMFIDACHSANSLDGEQKRGVGADITQVVNELSSTENGVVMFASSTGRQVSIENDRWKNGAFTEALIEGLGGAADYVPDGKLTIAELDLWLSDRVKVLTDKRQAPVVRKPDTVPDFPIALVRQ
ncbi:hypothetical protein BH10PSE7_BH10PSE7_37530 [soil metagenome]